MHDAAIIGGGPAGSAFAAHFAREGRSVVLLESRRFPREKVCGEFISPAATRDLEAVLNAERLLAAGARRVDRFALEVGERRLVAPLASPAWGLGRGTLDRELALAAARAGATIEQPALVRKVEYRDDRVEVCIEGGARIAARVVVHADGFGRFDPAGPTPRCAGLIAMKCRLDLAGGVDEIVLRACAGGYIGLMTVEGGATTCALAARAVQLTPFGRDLDGFVCSLWPQFNAGARVGPWLTCGVARSAYRRPGHIRSLRIGNAAGAVDPVGGEGIGLALWSARVLAGLLGESRLDAGGLARVQRRMKRAYAARLRVRLPGCRVIAESLMRPWLVRAAWPVLGAMGLGPWYALTGKPRGSLRFVDGEPDAA